MQQKRDASEQTGMSCSKFDYIIHFLNLKFKNWIAFYTIKTRKKKKKRITAAAAAVTKNIVYELC